jgi:hypothetical protein
VSVDSIADLIRSIREAAGTVVISAGSQLKTSDLRALTAEATEHGKVIGFISGWGGDAVCHARKIAAYAWRGGNTDLIWSHRNIQGVAPGRYGPTEVLDADDRNLLERLRKGGRAVVLTTHGNGVHAALSSSYLCTATPYSRAGTPTRGHFLPCGYDPDRCIFDYGGATNDMAPPLRIAPSQINADVLIFQTCNGIIAHGSILDPAQSLAREFINSSYVGALVTTYCDITDDGWVGLYALGLVNEGRRLGEVVLELNRAASQSDERGTPWVLLGDPGIRLAQRAAVTELAPNEPAVMTVLPGVNLACLSSRRPHIVSGTGSPTDIVYHQIRDSRYVVAFNHAILPSRAVLHARAVDVQNGPPVALQERRVNAELEFSLSVVDAIARDPKTCRLLDISLVRRQLRKEIRDLTSVKPFDLRTNSGGTSAHNPSITEGSGYADWLNLHCALATLLGDALVLNGRSDQLGSGRGALTEPGTSCAYCGTPVSRRQYKHAPSGLMRAVTWCADCGFLSNTSSLASGITLVGNATPAAGKTHYYRLSVDAPTVASWGAVYACLRMRARPWAIVRRAPVTGRPIRPGTHIPALELEIELEPRVPAGLYQLDAAIAVDGDLWMCRRPVLVRDSVALNTVDS